MRMANHTSNACNTAYACTGLSHSSLMALRSRRNFFAVLAFITLQRHIPLHQQVSLCVRYLMLVMLTLPTLRGKAVHQLGKHYLRMRSHHDEQQRLCCPQWASEAGSRRSKL